MESLELVLLKFYMGEIEVFYACWVIGYHVYFYFFLCFRFIFNENIYSIAQA